MAKMEYFPCYNSYLAKTGKLTDEELGRLFRALMTYTATGERMELDGREDLAFDFIADDIDRAQQSYAERCDAAAKNGRRGGRPAKTENQTVLQKPNGLQNNQTVFYETEKSQNKDKDEDKSKDKYKDKTKRQGEDAQAREDDDDHDADVTTADVIAHSQAVDTVEAAWRRTGGKLNAADYDVIDQLLTDHPPDEIADAMQAAFDNGAGGKWAYVRKVLANWRAHGRGHRSDTGKATTGDIMQRASPEERQRSWGAAVVRFEDDT